MRGLLVAMGVGALGLWAGQCFCQTSDLSEKAKQMQNPLAVKTSVTVQESVGFKVGPEKKAGSLFTLQPVIPARISPDWNVLTQTSLNFASLPSFGPEQDHVNGLTDTTLYAALSPNRTGEWLWGAGSVFQFPTHSNDVLGTEKWGIGPAAVVTRTVGDWVYGGIFSQTWTFAGPREASPISLFALQYLVSHNFPDGWYLVSNGTALANWRESRWTVPLGGGLGKALNVNGGTLNLQMQGFYNALAPETGAGWYLQFSLQYMFP